LLTRGETGETGEVDACGDGGLSPMPVKGRVKGTLFFCWRPRNPNNFILRRVIEVRKRGRCGCEQRSCWRVHGAGRPPAGYPCGGWSVGSVSAKPMAATAGKGRVRICLSRICPAQNLRTRGCTLPMWILLLRKPSGCERFSRCTRSLVNCLSTRKKHFLLM
jgi:hypothetical protein